MYPEADKLGKQFKYASSLRIPFVAILGPEETEKGQVALKNMQSGEQQEATRGKAIEILKNSVSQRRKDAKEDLA